VRSEAQLCKTVKEISLRERERGGGSRRKDGEDVDSSLGTGATKLLEVGLGFMILQYSTVLYGRLGGK
jgi:hypothetical protein